MNILIVAPCFFPRQAVGAFRMTTLADFLLKKGEKVFVIRGMESEEIKSIENPYLFLDHIIEIRVQDGKGMFSTSLMYQKEIIRLCEKHKMDVIIYTCGPYYAMHIAWKIKKINSVPFIIDIRDNWLLKYAESKVTLLKQYLQYPLKYYLQKRTFNVASKIVIVSNGVKEIEKKLYSKYDSKIEIILNGYDDQRVSNPVLDDNIKEIVNQVKNFEGIKIGMAGKMSLYSLKYTKMVFRAIDAVQKAGHSIKLYHMGQKEQKIDNLLSELKIDDTIYSYLGYIENNSCFDILKIMDMNLIINVSEKGYGTKLFDYLFIEKPILYVGIQKGEIFEIVAQNNTINGVCSSSKEIEKYICKNKMKVDKKIDKHIYTRSFQNDKYYTLIQRVVLDNMFREEV